MSEESEDTIAPSVTAESTGVKFQLAETEQRAASLTESGKGLVIINGGGAVAMGAFLGQTWGSISAARPWVLSGILILVVGVAFASMLPFVRYRGSFRQEKHAYGTAKWWKVRHHRYTVASVVAFIIGMVLAVVGGFRAL